MRVPAARRRGRVAEREATRRGAATPRGAGIRVETIWSFSEFDNLVDFLCFFQVVQTVVSHGNGVANGKSAVGNGIGNGTANGVGNGVGNSTGNGMGNGVGNGTGNGVGNGTGNGTGNGVGNGTEKKIGNGLSHRLSRRDRPAAKDESTKALEELRLTTIRGNIEGVRNALRKGTYQRGTGPRRAALAAPAWGTRTRAQSGLYCLQTEQPGSALFGRGRPARRARQPLGGLPPRRSRARPPFRLALSGLPSAPRAWTPPSVPPKERGSAELPV